MGNTERNTYVRRQITAALLSLLKTKPLEKITIRQLAEAAVVSRVSFYRNYEDKEDVIRSCIHQMISEWHAAYMEKHKDFEPDYYTFLFSKFEQNRGFYQMLFENGLGDLLLNCILEIAGPKSEKDLGTAYVRAWFSYGLYGWIREWAARGMPEDAEAIAFLLQSAGGGKTDRE